MLNSKGQGALEYLLIISGAVLIAAIVISLLAVLGSESQEEATIASNYISNGDVALRHLIRKR